MDPDVASASSVEGPAVEAVASETLLEELLAEIRTGTITDENGGEDFLAAQHEFSEYHDKVANVQALLIGRQKAEGAAIPTKERLKDYRESIEIVAKQSQSPAVPINIDDIVDEVP